MSNYQKFELVDDLVLFKDPGIFKEKYYLISNERNVVLKLDEVKFAFFNKVLPLFKKNYCKEDIIRVIENDFGSINIFEQLVVFLESYNLFKEQTAENKNRIEFEMSGKKIKELNLENVSIKYKKYIDTSYKLILIFSIFVIFCSIFILATRFDVVFAIESETKAFSWKNVSIYEYLLVFIGILITLFCHEMGHIISAIHSGVIVKSISFTMLLGIAPVFYVKYKNINLTPSLTRIKIMLSGIFINLVLACLFFILLNLTSYWIFAVFMLINIGAITSSLSLMGTSDGYFALTTLFNIEGLRWNTLKTISKVLNKKENVSYIFRNFKTFLFVMYIIFSYALSFTMLNYYIKLVTKYVGASNLFFLILNKILIFLIVFIFVKYLINFYKSVKSI